MANNKLYSVTLQFSNEEFKTEVFQPDRQNALRAAIGKYIRTQKKYTEKQILYYIEYFSNHPELYKVTTKNSHFDQITAAHKDIWVTPERAKIGFNDILNMLQSQ